MSRGFRPGHWQYNVAKQCLVPFNSSQVTDHRNFICHIWFFRKCLKNGINFSDFSPKLNLSQSRAGSQDYRTKVFLMLGILGSPIQRLKWVIPSLSHHYTIITPSLSLGKKLKFHWKAGFHFFSIIQDWKPNESVRSWFLSDSRLLHRQLLIAQLTLQCNNNSELLSILDETKMQPHKVPWNSGLKKVLGLLTRSWG